jgi:hypothetical protein
MACFCRSLRSSHGRIDKSCHGATLDPNRGRSEQWLITDLCPFFRWLPLMAVVTPSTLVVVPSGIPNVTSVEAALPVMNYSAYQLWAQWTSTGGGGYAAPTRRISRLTAAVAAQGAILPVAAPFPNSSYTLEFYGPSLRCGPPSNATLARAIANSTIQDGCDEGGDCSGYVLVYTGFVPDFDPGVDINSTIPSEEVLYGLAELLNSTQGNGSSLGVRTVDQSFGSETMRVFVVVPDGNQLGYVANKTIECGMYNSSYSANWTFQNGQQSVTIQNQTQLNGVPFNLTGIDDSGDGNDGGPTSAAAVSYASLMDSFGRLLVGTLSFSHYGPITPYLTQITSTVLMETQELDPVSATADPGISSIANLTTSDALEQLFTNLTLSLFSDSYFL